MADYLIAVAEALNLPPAENGVGGSVYHRLLADRVTAVVRTLRIALRDGITRALPAQAATLRTRITELPADSYQWASENWTFTPARHKLGPPTSSSESC